MGLHGAHIISVAQFERTELDELFDLAAACEPVARGQERSSAMAGRLLANLFYEPSTRTRLSFDAAFQRLGGAVQTTVGMQFSSMAKGETLEDTIRVVNGYADVICMRHPERGSAARAASGKGRSLGRPRSGLSLAIVVISALAACGASRRTQMIASATTVMA